MKLKYGLLACMAICCSDVLASSNLTVSAIANNAEKKLTSNDPNYFAYVFPQTGGELKDDHHLEFYLSVQYPMFKWCNNHALLFIYNGLYDFYILEDGRYTSAPIISRRQNPGISYEYASTEHGQFRLGYFHESNGQTLDRTDGQTAFDEQASQHNKEYALAQVSRGWDYVNLRYQSKDMCLAESWGLKNRFNAEVRTYMHKQMFKFDREDEIFWETVDEQPKISDYDGLRLMYEIFAFNDNLYDFAARIEVKTGTSDRDAVENFSIRYAVSKRIWVFPLTAFYFNGYGKEPSTYNERTEYVGIGVEFR